VLLTPEEHTPPPLVTRARVSVIPRALSSAASFGGGPACQRHAGLGGQLAGQRLGLGDLHGGEARGTSGARAVGQGRRTAVGEPATPGANCVQVQTRLACDPRVGAPPRRVQHDLRAYPQPVLGLVAVGHLLQPLTPGGSEEDRACGSERQRGRTVHEKRTVLHRPAEGTAPSTHRKCIPASPFLEAGPALRRPHRRPGGGQPSSRRTSGAAPARPWAASRKALLLGRPEHAHLLTGKVRPAGRTRQVFQTPASAAVRA
jgi:hypothetical protein